MVVCKANNNNSKKDNRVEFIRSKALEYDTKVNMINNLTNKGGNINDINKYKEDIATILNDVSKDNNESLKTVSKLYKNVSTKKNNNSTIDEDLKDFHQ